MFTYPQALDYLRTFDIRFPQLATAQDPQRIIRARQIAAHLGDPHLRYPLIHIAGTKGKGSTAAMCAAILQAAGLKVGLYTSPNLQDLRERFLIDGALISEAALAALVSDARAAIDAVTGARYPEVIAALALFHFAREQVDAAVIEVGVGGRLDSTNIVQPTVSAITRIALDHVPMLGTTLEQIAAEKAGIIKPGVPVISAVQPESVKAVLAQTAHERGCTLEEAVYQVGSVTRAGTEVILPHPLTLSPTRFTPGEGETYTTTLIGAHQAMNAAVAVRACQAFAQERGLVQDQAAIRAGLQGAFLPGRLEIVTPASPLILLDSAHNPESGARLRETLDDLFPERPRVLVYGSKATKDAAGVMRALFGGADTVILTQAGDPPTSDPALLATPAREGGYAGDLVIEADAVKALRVARSRAGAAGLVCITGSMYLVGALRTVLGLAPGQKG